MSTEATPAHRGRPKKTLRSKWIQLQTAADATAAASSDAAVAVPAESYSAIIRLTPSLIQAILAGHAANIQFDDKDKASFVVDNIIHPLRCAKEDPAQISVYESIAYEHEDENEEPMGATAAVPSRLPLFAPFHAVAHPLPLQVLHKFHAPREIGISDDAEPGPAASPKAKKQRKRKGATEEATTAAAAAAEEAADETTAAKKQRAGTKKKDASSALAAAPSAKTAAEPLRARLIHLLAAQPQGLSLTDVAVALSVAPSSLAPVLDAATRYVPPGVFTLLPACYSELRVDSWPDYSQADRTRIVDRMRRMESEGVAGVTVSRELLERYSSAALTAEDATTAAVTPLPAPHFPPPPAHSQLPDEIPASMIDPASEADFASSEPEAAAASSSSAEPKLTPPRILCSYIEFLALRTQFLQQRTAYQRLQSWVQQVELMLQQQRAAASAASDASTAAVWQRQVDEWEQQQAQNLTVCRRKCTVAHRLLTHSLQSLSTYANQHGLTTNALQIEHQ